MSNELAGSKAGVIRAAGILLFRDQPCREFLLMKHADRWDLPKGHLEAGETELEGALRELEEETGIPRSAVKLDREFRYESRYRVRPRRRPDEWADKVLAIFLGELKEPHEVRVTEHLGWRWWPWPPQESIQPQAIDPLLEAVDRYWKQRATRRSEHGQDLHQDG